MSSSNWQTLETDKKWDPFPHDPAYQQFKHEYEKAANTEKEFVKNQELKKMQEMTYEME
jgi:hypothetical protein